MNGSLKWGAVHIKNFFAIFNINDIMMVSKIKAWVGDNMEEMINQIKTFIIDQVDPAFIILFGSVAKGETHLLSDVDVAFYKEASELNSYEIFLLAQELADLLKREVDLIDLSKASTVFKAQVYGTGEVLYCNDETILNSRRMTALSMYARLNEERAEIIKNIRESGSIYGE